jgi:ABC-type glutathione transport system ATPase component
LIVMTDRIDIRAAFAAMGWDVTDFGAQPPTTRRKCNGCETEVDRMAPLGLCGKCLVREVEARRAEVFRKVIPEAHITAEFGAPHLAVWCQDATATRWAHAFATKAPPCPTVTLWGTTGSGKSTLAAAMLRTLLTGARSYAGGW